MRSFVVVVFLFGLCFIATAEGSKHHRARGGGGGGRSDASLSNSFMQLDEVKNIHPQHLKVLKHAVDEFEKTIDRSKLNAADKEAVKRKAVHQFMGRVAEHKRKGRGH